MAIIYSYPRATPKATDLIIGTVVHDEDAANPVEGMPTRTFTVADVAEFASKYTLTSEASGNDANIVLTSSTGIINKVGLLRGVGLSITDNGSNSITLENTGVLSITATNSTFINNAPLTSSVGNVAITSSLSAAGTPGATNYLRGDNVWYTPVTLLGTQNTPFINLTPNVATNGDVTVSALLSATGTPTSEKYLRGDNSWSTPVTSITTSDTTYIDLTPNTGSVGTVDITASLSATGPASNTTFLRGDNVWAIPYALNSVHAGVGISIDTVDPINPVINNTGVIKIIAGNDIEITPVDGSGNVTINSTSQGGVTSLIAGDNIVLNPINGLGDVTVNAPNLIAYSEVSTVNMDFVSDDASLGGGSPSDTILSTQLAIKTYVDNAVVGGLVYQGGYDSATNTPILDNRGTQIAVEKGWTYTVTADGTFYGETVRVGDVLIAEQNLAVGTGSLTDWTTVQSNIDLATAGTSGTAIRGLAGFDSADFTVADGFVELGSTTVTAGSYTNANITVDENGRITSAVSGYAASDVAVLDEGVQLTPTVQSMNFTGAGVTATTVGNDVTVNVLQAQSVSNLVYDVRNQTGATIPAGSAVYIIGGSGSSDHVNVVLALADNDEHSSKTFGITSAAIPDNSIGPVTLEGLIEGIDTSLWDNGDTLWLSPTVPGGIQNTIPITPAHAVFLGYAVRIQQNNGSIFVKIQNGPELSELHDVLITDIAEGQIIAWDNANSYWKNVAPPPGTTSLVQNDFVGTGSQVDFILSIAPRSTTYTSVYISGAYQEKSTYSVSGTTLTFTEAPLNGDTIEVMIITDLAVGDTVNGTGTANYVTKWIDGDTIGNSVIYDNGTNVGIGTSSPSVELEIASTTPQIRLNDTDGFTSTFTQSNRSLILATDTATGQILFNTDANTERMRITDTGNVGIGTSSPTGKLEVAGSVHLSQGTGNAYIGTNAGNLGTSTGSLNVGLGENSFFSLTLGSNNAAIGHQSLNQLTTGSFNTAVGRRSLVDVTTGSNNIGIGYTAGDDITTGSNNTIIGDVSGTAGMSDTVIIAAGSTERLRIDSAGKVLINKTASESIGSVTAADLQIGTTGIGASIMSYAAAAGPAGIMVLGHGRGNANGLLQNNDVIGQIRFAAGDGTDALSLGGQISVEVDGVTGANDMPSRMVFSTASDGSNTATERMRITSAGNVTINGTDNRPLEITSFNTASAGAGWDLNASSVSGVVSISTAGSERMRIAAGGFVGIGTDSASAPFQVVTSENVIAKFTSTDANANIGFEDDSTTAFTGLGAVANDLRILTGATERMRIDSAGDINIYEGIISGTAYSTSAVVAATNLDFKSAQVFTKTITGDTTFTFSNTQIGMVKDFILTGGGTATLTWPVGTKLAAGTYDGAVSNLIQILVVGTGDYWLTISQPQ